MNTKKKGKKFAKKLHKYGDIDIDIAFLNAYLDPDNWGAELLELREDLNPEARGTLLRIITRN